MSGNIRFASPGDVPAIVSLLGALFAQEADFTPDPARQGRGVNRILADPSIGRILVCDRGGTVAGMVSLLFTVSTSEGAPAAWLEDMFVAPEHRGAGVGQELLEAALLFAGAAGMARVTLLTDRSNTRAQRFYARNGFRESSMVPMRREIPTVSGQDPGSR
ncbi:MAG TPA: GNAT family N-acetyltransferase [Candidatus Deferrimicrobiaceae bacterium]|jgi:GNAT superfamily N-acetyltransferase